MKESGENQSLKKRALKAVIWNAIQRYGSLIISFISNIILARLLTPNDYGLVGLLTVFISVANVITESGFNSALIQQKEVTDVDYNTVFYWNLCVSIFLILFLYWVAPYIAEYFERPMLSSLLRVESIILVINSFCIVQTTRLMKFLRFHILAVRTIGATLAASVVGVFLAWKGFGVWSLVWQGIVSSLFGAILLWSITDWRPSLQYSWTAFRRMFKFGAYISVSSICNTLFVNLQSFIIGKSFSITDLGFYTQAKKLESIPVEGTSSVLNTVLFPIYSAIGDDRERHRRIVRKNMNVITFLTFPLMLVLILVAPSLFQILFTDKWNASIPMFQILCIFGMTSPLNMANVEIFRSIGEGRVYLILQTVKRIIGIGMILFFVQFGLFVMLWSIVGFGIISYGLNIIFTQKIFGYTFKNQLYDVIPNFLLASSVFFVCDRILAFFEFDSNWIILVGGVLIYSIIYLLSASLLRMKGIIFLRDLIKND